jgi:hypothetical protein
MACGRGARWRKRPGGHVRVCLVTRCSHLAILSLTTSCSASFLIGAILQRAEHPGRTPLPPECRSLSQLLPPGPRAGRGWFRTEISASWANPPCRRRIGNFQGASVGHNRHTVHPLQLFAGRSYSSNLSLSSPCWTPVKNPGPLSQFGF